MHSVVDLGIDLHPGAGADRTAVFNWVWVTSLYILISGESSHRELLEVIMRRSLSCLLLTCGFIQPTSTNRDL